MSSIKPWTTEELQFLYDSRLNHKPYKIIAEHLGRTEDSVSSKYRDVNFAKLGIGNPELEATRFEERSKFTEKTFNTLNNKLDTFKFQTDAIVDAITKAITSLPKIPKPILRTPMSTGSRKNYTEDVGLLLGDLHIGHEHAFDET